MENEVLNTILSEFKKLNEHLDVIKNENNNKFSLIDARFDTLEELVLSMQNDIGLLQDKFANLENRISKLEDRISELESRISKLEDRISELENRISKLEDTMKDVQNKITSLENIIEDISNRMSQFENRLSSLEKITLRMEYTFNDKISALFDAHSYYSDQYQKIESRLRKNEIKVANLSISTC